MLRRILSKFVSSQVKLSKSFDQLLPAQMSIDGNRDFIGSLVPKYLAHGQTIYDIGGGKNPYLAVSEKERLNARVIGIDIDESELTHAPQYAYDAYEVADIADFMGAADADLVICQATLEHVQNVAGAFSAIASILKINGKALIFVPSRNAVFARLNLILPQRLKEKILYTVFPHTERDQGFVAFYDQCTPKQFRKLAGLSNMRVVEERVYYKSSYFSFFFPLYFLWRLWTLIGRAIWKEQAAETFCMVLEKQK